MRRLPAIGFAALLLATVGAFFVTQHLKTQNPYINGSPRADPGAIDPLADHVCTDYAKKLVHFDRTRVGFYLQQRADIVDVSVVNADGQFVATAAGSGRYVHPGNDRYVYFSWNGRTSSGRLAPDGTYGFRVSLVHEGVTLSLNTHVTVMTGPPHPVVTRVSPATISSPGHGVSIHFTPAPNRQTRVLILRTSASGPAKEVFSFGATGRTGRATWNGEIHRRPALAGTYLIGLAVKDAACESGQFPVVNPPQPGSTPHAGVTVRYLAATPPLVPTAAGTSATVGVTANGQRYLWTLYRAGQPRVLAYGHSTATSLPVHLPGGAAGLYTLVLHAGGRSASVPLVSYATGAASVVRVLLVLPSLTWAGNDQVDDTGDGLPDTLAGGDTIDLSRPLVTSPPAGFGDELGVLRALHSAGDAVQLTTDLGLAEGVGPRLTGHAGVLLDGSLTWVTPSVSAALRSYVQAGGHVASLGVESLLSTARLHRSGGVATAGPPQRHASDPFGATPERPGAPAGLITVFSDSLHLFGQLDALPGFHRVEVIAPPTSARAVSTAGASAALPVVTGFRLGHGTVVEVGLGSFGSSLAHNVGAQELLARLFRMLHG